MPPPRPITFNRFGGLRLDMPPDEVGPEEAIALADVDWADNNPGLLKPRAGATRLKSEEASAIYSALGRHSRSRLLTVKNTSPTKELVIIDLTGLEFASTKWTGLSIPWRVGFVKFGTPTTDYTYAYSETTFPIRTNGISFTEPLATVDGEEGTAMPIIKYADVWTDGGNRLVVATPGLGGGAGNNGPGGASTTESHVWFSDPGNAESWHTVAPEANYVQLNPGDGERITGICQWNGMIFVTKLTKMFVFYAVTTDSEGGPEFRYRTIDLGAKMIDPLNAGNSVPNSQSVLARGDEGVYLLTEAGVMVTNGGRPMLISQPLTPLTTQSSIYGPMWQAMGGLTRWNQYDGLVYFNRRLYVLGGTRMLVYDLERNAWLVWRTAMNSMVAWEKFTIENRLYFTGSTIKGILAYDEGSPTDPSSPIEPFWQSGFYNLGTDDEKSLVETKLWGKGQLTFTGYGDLSEEADFSEAVDLGNALLLPFTQEARDESDQTAALFSHRFDLGENARIGRITRYLRETETARSKRRD